MPDKYEYLRIHLDPDSIRAKFDGTPLAAKLGGMTDDQLAEVGEAALYSDRVHDAISEILRFQLETDWEKM